MTAIAIIGTGGTIASEAHDPLDVLGYDERGRKLAADELVARLPESARSGLELHVLPFTPVGSEKIGPDTWRELARMIRVAAAARPELAGFVILHGTSTLEETAWYLNLVLEVSQTVVLTGAQRPASAVGADGPANLHAALRVAASPEARHSGVLVVLNDEIHSAREVSKTSTYRLNAFTSPEAGPLGVVDGDRVVMQRRPLRPHTRASPFAGFDGALPRVDIAYAYAGGDGVAVRAFAAAGARGIVSAGLVPGLVTPEEEAALHEARAQGIAIVQGVRGAGGRVAPRPALDEAGFVAAGSLNPQKARILLMLALASGVEVETGFTAL